MENLVIFDLTFLPEGREFDSNLLENVKIPPNAPPPPRQLDIDRCITCVRNAVSEIKRVENYPDFENLVHVIQHGR